MRNTLKTCLLTTSLLVTSWGDTALAGAGPTLCDSIVVTNVVSKTTTQVVAHVTGQKTYICMIIATHPQGGGGNVSATADVEYGTQTTNPCDTGTTDITGAVNFGSLSSANTGKLIIQNHQPAVITVPASQDVCIITGGTTITTVNFVVFYAQHA